jgi:ribonuclease T2
MRWRIAAVALGIMLAACSPNEAGGLPQGEGYDFFVLSLSWSPSYCEAGGADANRRQCSARSRHAFVVHGLWPQFESGWPEFCTSDEPGRVPDALVGELLDIMPSAGLIGHQWRKHGSCAGMSQRDYFSVVRGARERVTVPERFEGTAARITVAPAEVEAAFMEANAGLAADGIAATCHEGYLSEVRICLTKALEFRSCEEVDRRACRLPHATMPASH